MNRRKKARPLVAGASFFVVPWPLVVLVGLMKYHAASTISLQRFVLRTLRVNHLNSDLISPLPTAMAGKTYYYVCYPIFGGFSGLTTRDMVCLPWRSKPILPNITALRTQRPLREHESRGVQITFASSSLYLPSTGSFLGLHGARQATLLFCGSCSSKKPLGYLTWFWGWSRFFARRRECESCRPVPSHPSLPLPSR